MLPVLFYLKNKNDKSFLIDFIKFFIVFLLTSIIIFLPVVLKYGINFLTFYPSELPLIYIIKNLTVDLWGITGSVAIIIFSLTLFFHLRNFQLLKHFISDIINQLSIIVVTVYLVLFLPAPYEPEYLIPMIPFILILLVHNLTKRQIIIPSVLLLLSSFTVGLNISDRPWSHTDSSLSTPITFNNRTINIEIFSRSHYRKSFKKNIV